MAKSFHCDKCDYTCARKWNLDRHNELKHLDNTNTTIIECPFCNKVFKNNITKTKHIEICTEKNPHVCNFCFKKYKHVPSRIRHEKTCIKNPYNDKIENNNNTQNIQQQTITNITNNIQNTTINNTNIQNNITINCFGNERIDHLTSAFIESCIKQLHNTGLGVPNMIEQIHLNDEVPENINVLIDSYRRNQLKVYDGNNWKIVSNTEVMDNMINKAGLIMHRFYNSPDGIHLKSQDEITQERYYIRHLLDLINMVPYKRFSIHRKIYARIVNYSKLLKKL